VRRRLEVLLPDDLTNREYASIAHATWAMLSAVGLGEVSSLRTDDRITDVEMNRAFDEDAEGYPWGP
jgi:hypothetical protein